ncbi:hypothetical protein [Roseovarius dicentrarchi]|uniref:hypothetical protein n=1 Tax=Roseovarius dicentrarchi TaxID=2250573 RepID=UPI0013966768|nr:hypothetical protein [Roseovarius dicentrarchi]
MHAAIFLQRVGGKDGIAQGVDRRLHGAVGQVSAIIDEKGIEATERDLRRALDLSAMSEPNLLKDAVKTAQSRNVRLLDAEPVPILYHGPEGIPTAKESAYGVFPDQLNKEERGFATVLDEDDTGTASWWMRNPENERCAVRMLRPRGKLFFPDFIVGVARRSTPDCIAPVEIMDDGETGRLNSDSNIEKIRIQHREYNNVFWSFRDSGTWVRARYASGLHRIVPKDRFDMEELVFHE